MTSAFAVPYGALCAGGELRHGSKRRAVSRAKAHLDAEGFAGLWRGA